MSSTLLTPATSLLGATIDDDVVAPWASDHHASDVVKRQVQEIFRSRGVQSCQARDDGRPELPLTPGGLPVLEQASESNRFVMMENIGKTQVVNPWVKCGRNDFRSPDRIAARAIEPGMIESDKARVFWWLEVRHRFHREGDNDELLDQIKLIGISKTTILA